MPDVRKRIAPITIERYHRMIDLGVFDDWNVELLNGALVEKMSKSELHLFLVDLLAELIREYCAKGRYWVRKEDPITIGDSEPEPDVSVVAGSRAEFRRLKPSTAQFVIEVAITTVSVDRAKASVYAKAGIPEFWLVRPEDRITEVYRNPAAGEYAEREEIAAEIELQSSALPGFAFNLAEALED